MGIELVIFAVCAWAIGLVSLFFPAYVAKVFFMGAKKLIDNLPFLADKTAGDFLDTLYSNPNAIDEKFPGVNTNTRVGGLISLIVAIALTCKLFQ